MTRSVAAAAGVTVPPPGVEAPLPWVDPHAAPDRRMGREEHQGTVCSFDHCTLVCVMSHQSAHCCHGVHIAQEPLPPVRLSDAAAGTRY
jgi:hypothetical protein